MIRSDFEDAKTCVGAVYESEEFEILEAIAAFYRKASEEGISAKRTYEILRNMARTSFLVQYGIECEHKEAMKK